jgi:hypothetical protein
LSNEIVDIIISDIQMADYSIELSKILKKNKQSKQYQTNYCTWRQLSSTVEINTLGFDEILIKPTLIKRFYQKLLKY